MKYKLIDLLDFKTQGVNTTTDHISYVEKGYKIVQAKNIAPYNITFDESNFVDEETFSRIKDNHKLHKGEVLYTNIGSQLGNSAIYEFDDEAIITWNVMKLIPNKDIIDNYYLCYLLNSNKPYIKALNTSSTMPFVSGKALMNVEFEVPDLHTQKKVVKVLKNIEDKIKLNNEINNNLFELLKQEFREKFYNKKEKDSYLRNYISETIGGDWGKSAPEENNNTMVYCVRGADIPSMEYGNKGNAPIRYILEKNYKNKKLDPNNIIIEISGGSSTQSTGRTAFITKSILDMYDSPLLCTNFCRAIEAKSDILAPFVYLNLKLMYDDDIFFNWENGTTGIKNLALNDLLNNLKVKTPDEMMLKNFYLLFNNIINKISNNSNENIKLEQLRDTLLPKLMNGEIDLGNIEI